jgi:zinc finger SWIM domain-containing protein 3
MRDIFTLGMRSTQLSESFNSDLKTHLKLDLDIIRFLKHFERAVQTKRNKELDEEFEARKKLPRIRMNTPMLVQASKIYTSRYLNHSKPNMKEAWLLVLDHWVEITHMLLQL